MSEVRIAVEEKPHFDRALGPVEGTAIVVGTVIGSGIFLTPGEIAGTAGRLGFGTILLVWLVCGVLSLGGALAYAELAGMFPRAGGQYVFMREAYGRPWAFLFGWMEFWIARSGSVAALAVAFAEYAGHFTEMTAWGIRWTGFLVVVLLTFVNYVGVRWGAAVQVLFTATKVAALGALVVCAFALPGGSGAHWQPLFREGTPSPGEGGTLGLLFTAFGTAMIASLWSYDGWTNGAAVSEEIKNPQRDVPRALVYGTLMIMAIYVAANLAYHYVLPLDAVAGSKRVAADAAEVLFGPVGAGLIAAAVMISTFGAANGLLLTGPRIFFAMARDRVFFRDLGQLHRRFHTPHLAILLQGLWSAALVLVPFHEVANRLFGWRLPERPYEQLLTYVIFGSWLFYGMTVAGLVLLRRRLPRAERPYRALGYPVVPLLFVLTAVAFVAHTLKEKPAESLAGLGILVAGLPAYWWWTRRGLPGAGEGPE